MYKTATLTAENTFTEWADVLGDFTLSISGTFVGTLTVQRRFSDALTTILDVNTYTAPVEATDREPISKLAHMPGAVTTQYRVGFKTTAFSSGSAVCRIGQA